MILEPLLEKIESLLIQAKDILSNLEKENYDISWTYDMFIKKLHLTNSEYIDSIRSMLDMPTLFLRRRPCDYF